MLKKIIAILMLGLMLSLAVFADQAAWITKDEAQKTAAFLKGKAQIKHYCAPCDDKSVTTEDISTVEAAPTGTQDYWEVLVNGKGIDLAYVYFQTKDGKWKNLAKEMDVEVDDVPKFLDEKDGE